MFSDSALLRVLQPRQIVEIKQFLLTARRPDAKSVKIKKTGPVTKFKVRCSKFLYTLCVEDNDKADKLKQSLPPGEPSYYCSATSLGSMPWMAAVLHSGGDSSERQRLAGWRAPGSRWTCAAQQHAGAIPARYEMAEEARMRGGACRVSGQHRFQPA